MGASTSINTVCSFPHRISVTVVIGAENHIDDDANALKLFSGINSVGRLPSKPSNGVLVTISKELT